MLTSSLLNEAREKLEYIIYRMCKSYGLTLPRRYRRNARKDISVKRDFFDPPIAPAVDADIQLRPEFHRCAGFPPDNGADPWLAYADDTHSS